MTQFTPGLIIEIFLIVLLLVTVGYCLVLNQRLSRLRSSQDELRQIIDDLGTATQTAEYAIRGLKATTEEADARLSDKLHKAQLLTRELSVLSSTHDVQYGSADPAAPQQPAPQQPAPQQSVPARRDQAQPDLEQWRQIAMSRLKKAS